MDDDLEDMAAFYANMEVPDSEPLGWTLVLPHYKVLDRKTGELLPHVEEWTRNNLQERVLIIPLLPPETALYIRANENPSPVQLHFMTEQDFIFFKMWWE